MNGNNNKQDQLCSDTPSESSLNNPISDVINTENTSLAYPKSPSTTLFPVHAFNTLNSLLSRPHWQVPVLPDSQLETILLASINMAKHGEDVHSQDCLRFYSDGLISSFQKIFRDDAVTRWDSHILHFIYANSLLGIELCSIKAKSDCLAILELETILFDPNSQFHTRSIISTSVTHEIRYGVHRNVVCRFEDIIKLLPHISISNENDSTCQQQPGKIDGDTNAIEMNNDPLTLNNTVQIKEYSISYANYKDAPILVDFINLFGRLNGFDRLKARFLELDNKYHWDEKQRDMLQQHLQQQSNLQTEFLSLSLINAYLHPFALCSNYLSDSVIEEYFKPIVTIVVNYLSHLTDDQIKRETKKEMRKDDFITGLKLSLCTLTKRIPSSTEDDIETIELLSLNVIYRFFQLSSFNGKMNTLNELIRLLPNTNSLRVGQWITDIKLLKLLLRENLHQLQYVEKVEEIIRFMIRKLLLTLNDLDSIWESQIGKHETIIKNIFNMLTHLALEFSMNQLNHLFHCFKQSWKKATKRQRERLIDLITMLAEQDTDGMMMQKTLDLLWDWAISLKFSTDLMNASLKSHAKILSCNNKPFICQLRSVWLGKLASFLKIEPNTDEGCLLPAAKQFIEIANLYNTGSPNENTLIQSINQRHNVLKAAVDCIIQTMWSVHEERLNLIMKNQSIPSKSSHSINTSKHQIHSNLQLIKVKELLKLLRYLIFQCHLLCPIDLLQGIWDSLLKPTFQPNSIINNHILNKFHNQIILSNDCDLCFKWFILFLNDSIWLIYRDFIWDNYTTLNPKLMTNAGVEFVVQLFCRINSDNTCVISELNELNTIKLLSMTSPSSSLPLSSTIVNHSIIPNETNYTVATINDNYSTVTNTTTNTTNTTTNTTDTTTTMTTSTSMKLVNLNQLWNFILYSNKIVYQKICKLLLQLYTNFNSNINLNKRKELCFNIMKLCYAYIKRDYNELISSIEKQTNYEATLSPSSSSLPTSLSCDPEIKSAKFKRILRILKLLKRFTVRMNLEMYINDASDYIPLKRSWIGSSFFLTVTCQGLPILFPTNCNNNNISASDDIIDNNKQIYLSDGKTVTITLIVHGNLTLGELRVYLLNFCLHGFTSINNNSNDNGNNYGGRATSGGSSSSSSGIQCQDNNVSHSITNSMYQLELRIINMEQTNSNNCILHHNIDNELLVNLFLFYPNWTRNFLDNRDHINNDVSFVHLELSAKLMFTNNELSSSTTESSTTTPGSLQFSSYYLKVFDNIEVNATQQSSSDIALGRLHTTDNTTTTISNNNSLKDDEDHLLPSELKIFDSIIDRNFEEEQLANNNNSKCGSLLVDSKLKIDDSDALKCTQQLDMDREGEFIFNTDQRIEFLLNLSRIALALNHSNVYHSIMQLLNCMPLHKKLIQFIKDSLIQLVDKKIIERCNEQSTEPLLSQTWFHHLLTKPNVSTGVFHLFNDKQINLENTPNYIELLYTIQVLYCLMMPSCLVKHYHFIKLNEDHNQFHTSCNNSNNMYNCQDFVLPNTTTTNNNNNNNRNISSNTMPRTIDFTTNNLFNQIPDWSDSITITLLLLRGGALNLLLSSPLLVSSFTPTSSLYHKLINCDKNEGKHALSHDHLLDSHSSLGLSSFASIVNKNDDNQIIFYDTTIHWKLLYHIRLWLLRLIRVLLICTANTLVLYKLDSTSDYMCNVFKKSSFYQLLISLAVSVKDSSSCRNDFSFTNSLRQSSQPLAQSLSDSTNTTTATTKMITETNATGNLDGTKDSDDGDVDNAECNIEHICKLLLHTYKLTSSTNHPVLGGDYFLLLHALHVAQLTIVSNISLNEVKNYWLKSNIKSTFGNLFLTGWQTRYGCENPMEYLKDFSMKPNRIGKLHSCTDINNVQENNLLRDKSASPKNDLSVESFSQLALTENKFQDINEDILPVNDIEQRVTNNLSNSTRLSSSALSLLSCESTLSSSSSSSTLSSVRQLHSLSSSSSSNNENIDGGGNNNGRSSNSSSNSSSSGSSNNSDSNDIEDRNLSKLLYSNFHEQCFNSFRSGETQGSVIIEALNCITWYQCLHPQNEFCTFLKYPLSYKMLVSLSQNHSTVDDHRSCCDRRGSNHHKRSRQYRRYQPPSVLQSHSYQYDYNCQLTGADLLQDLLFSDSLIIRISTRYFLHTLLTFTTIENRDYAYYALEQMFNWLPNYVLSKITQSDEYFNLLVQIIPFMHNHEQFLQSAHQWLRDEIVWLRSMITDRQLGSCDASISYPSVDITPPIFHCATSPESTDQSSLDKESACLRPETIVHQFHVMSIEDKDTLICGHLRILKSLYQCILDSTHSSVQLLTCGDDTDQLFGEMKQTSRQINDFPTIIVNSVDRNNEDNVNCISTTSKTVNTNDLQCNKNSSNYLINQLYLVKDLVELLLFPASKQYNEIRRSTICSQINNHHNIINCDYNNINNDMIDHNSYSPLSTSHFSTFSNLSCSRKLMNSTFDFLLSITIRNPLNSQLLTTMLYDLIFSTNARPVNFNWNYNFGLNSTNSTSLLPSSSILSDHIDKNNWTNNDYSNYNRNENDMSITHRFVGLKNGGATCYMNSIIQQLFTLDPIRDCILSANPESLLIDCKLLIDKEASKTMNTSTVLTTSTISGDDIADNICQQRLDEESKVNTPIPNDQSSQESEFKPLNKEKIHHLNVLYHMQTIFGHLAYSRVKYYAPVEFWRHFKFRAEAVHVREQHDALEFFQILGNDLDEALELCKLPKIVEVVLGGKFADQKICLDCPHRYTSYESFTTLNVDILDHRNLIDSLEQYVKGELLEGDNAYHCRLCNKKIPILKRMCIQKLPLVLTIQLKRFDYDWEQGVSLKFNNYCEFPRHLDMLPYTVQGLKDSTDSSSCITTDVINNTNDNNDDNNNDDNNPCTKYNLRGVVVHSGQASSGHYYSFIRHYRPRTKTFKWYKYDDHNVIPVRLDKDEEAMDQWFGGEWKVPPHDLSKFTHLRSGKRWWSAYLLFYEREDFHEQIKNISISKLGLNPKQSRLTKRVQDIVNWQNIEHLHHRIQFDPLLPEFIYNLINNNIQLCMSNSSAYQNLGFITLELLLHFIFLRYHVVISNWKSWLLLFIKLISISAPIRCQLIKTMFLSSPDQIRFLQFHCPYPEMRFLSAALIIYVCHLCMNDPSVQCEDILHSFISLVNSSTTITHTATNTAVSGDDNNCCSNVCNTGSISTSTTNATTSPNIEVTANTTKITADTTPTTASVLSYLLRSTLNETKSPVFVENSTVDNAQITAQIFSATSFINRFINLPQKRSSSSLQNDSNISDSKNNNLCNQLINPGECLIQLIVHQLHFSPNTLALSSNKSFQEQQPYYHQPYSTIRSGNPSSSSFPMNAAVPSTLQSMMTVPSASSSTTLYPSVNNNNRSTSLPSSSLPTVCPSSAIWAQYFAILLDYANYGKQECCYLLKLHVPEILINYMLSYEVMLKTVETSASGTTTSIPYASLVGWNQEPRNYDCIQTSVKRSYNELSMEIQSLSCTNLRLSSCLDALVYALMTNSTVSTTTSNSNFDFYSHYKYDYNDTVNNEQNNLTTITNHDMNTTVSNIITYSGLKILLDLLSYLVRSCEIPSHYLNFPPRLSSSPPPFSSTTSSAICYPLAKTEDQVSRKINKTEKRSEPYGACPIISESLLTDTQANSISTNQRNPYCVTSTPLVTLSNSLIQLFFSSQSERIVKRLTGSLLNPITLKPISDMLLFFSYENMNFSDLILRELVYSILHPCDLDSILKLLERLLQLSDSLKSVRIRLLFSYSNDVDLFKLLNSNFIYETNTAAYQVFYLFINLLFTDPDVITYLSSEIYLVKVLSEITVSALDSLKLDTSDNWLDDKEKTIEALEQAGRILMNLIPSIATLPNDMIGVIENDSVQDDDVDLDDDNANGDENRITIAYKNNNEKQYGSRFSNWGKSAENEDVEEVEDDNDDYGADDDDDDNVGEEIDERNDHLITSLCRITSSSLSTSDDPELDHLPSNHEYMMSHNITRTSTSTIVDTSLDTFNHTCITAGPPATTTYTTITTASSNNNNNSNVNSSRQIYGQLLSCGSLMEEIVTQKQQEENSLTSPNNHKLNDNNE
ncbi:unnamed protein product [Schistosoma rodhaini]|uniref:USP domain-containing protein n=1 Tax=Schistosoma rodhaini TaxID=6188 RepID=A0AA85ESK4_9TREM|nr:unnamed protein product [Schistosoma rodhaini]